MLSAGTAQGDVTARFYESAPKDSFTITNTGPCPLGEVTVTLDLGASAAGLIFDVTGAGAGVSVFQPLEMVAGQQFLARIPEVKDGDSSISLPVTGLGTDDSITFTIDVDDTRGSSATMVSGSEISGAQVVIESRAGKATAQFNTDAQARVPFNACSA
jgi:hypothetical protein